MVFYVSLFGVLFFQLRKACLWSTVLDMLVVSSVSAEGINFNVFNIYKWPMCYASFQKLMCHACLISNLMVSFLICC